MADIDEIASHVEALSQSHEKPSELRASENIASVVSQGTVLSTPQQQQQSQTLSSTQINASISSNASPQLFQVQHQPGQAPQTMALINGQLVPVSAIPVNVPISGAVTNPIVLPQVQIQVQGQPTEVKMQASIIQKQSTIENATSTSTQEKRSDSGRNLEKAKMAPNPSIPTPKQSQPITNASPATQNTRDRGCGCGFWVALMRPFQQSTQPQWNDDGNKNNRDNNRKVTANSKTQEDNVTSQSFGTTAVSMAIQAINPVVAPAPAAQGDTLQASRDITAGDVGQNTTATCYPLGTNTVNATNHQGIYTGPTGMMTPDTGQHPVPVQQPSNDVDTQVVPASDPGLASTQGAADGTNVDGGGVDEQGGEELVDNGYDDGMDDMDDMDY